MTNHSASKTPVKLNSYSKNKLVSSIWIPGGVEKQRLTFDKTKIDKIVINPEQLVLETNTNNNNIKLNNSFTKRDRKLSLV